ncbi:MAG: tetratricopeptide repeat protein, partial [Waterburya sp.]
MVNHHINLDNLKSAWQEKYEAKKLVKNASNPNFQIEQGNQFLAQNKIPEAIACYRRALRLNPNSTQAHQQLAVALKHQGKLTEASVHYRQAISSNLTTTSNKSLSTTANNQSAVAQIYLQQAKSFEAQGEWQKAITACKEALDFEPQLAEAYKIWGDNLQKTAKTTEAMGYYAKALAIKPDYAEVCLNLGSLAWQQQQWQLALDYYQRAIAIQPGCASAYRNLARVYKKLGQQQLMLDCWYQAMQLEPEHANATEHSNLAQIMLEIGRPERAIACYQQALKLQPNLAQTYLSLGNVFVNQNQAAQAITVYRQGLKYFP